MAQGRLGKRRARLEDEEARARAGQVDVVFGLRYTARDGGETLKGECLSAIVDAVGDMTSGSGTAGPMQGFSVRHEFADAWYRFVNPSVETTLQTLELPIDETYFPYQFQGSGIQIRTVSLYLLPKQDADPALTEVSDRGRHRPRRST